MTPPVAPKRSLSTSLCGQIPEAHPSGVNSSPSNSGPAGSERRGRTPAVIDQSIPASAKSGVNTWLTGVSATHLGDRSRLPNPANEGDRRYQRSCMHALVKEFENRLGQARAFGDAVALGHRPAQTFRTTHKREHFQRNDQRIALMSSHEMGRYTAAASCP